MLSLYYLLVFSQIYLIKLLYQNFWFSHYTFPLHLNAIYIASHWFSASAFAISISPDPSTSKLTTRSKTGATENHEEPRREVNTLEQGEGPQMWTQGTGDTVCLKGSSSVSFTYSLVCYTYNILTLYIF